MAFVGHPILAEIRKGTRLRPTQTVDKSRPMIRAEGEQVPSVQPRGPPQAEPVAFSPPPPAANFAAVQRPAAQQQMMSSAPPPPPPPPGGNNKFAQQKPQQQQPAAAPTGGRQDEAGHRQKLLNEIRGGVRLRHVQTVDKSGLVLSEEEQQQLLRAGTPNGSLDSQGKSPSPSMVAFSPASSSSVLSPSPPVINGWPSASSSPAQRCSPSPTGGPGQQQQQRSNQPAVRHWPEVQTEAERQAAHNRQHSDYQFDEQKQIEERQKEVAALTGVGSASSKIAAFRQLLQQPTASTLPAHCTLPRAPKTTATWKNGAAATNGGGPTQQQRPPAAAKNNVNGQPPQQSQQQKRPPTQQMGNGQQQQQQKPRQTMLNGQQQRVAVANGGGQPQQNGLNRCNSHGQAQQPTPMASTPTSFHQQHQNQQQQQQPHYHQQMPSPAAAAPKWQQQPQPQAMIPVCPPPPRPAFQQQKNGFVSSTPAAPAAAPSPQAAPFFRSYTPRATGGAHRQNFDRIRGQFKGAAGGPAEEPPQERGAEAVWKSAVRQRKEQQQQQLPPPLPSCPPPPLDGSQPPEWETLREQFKFAVDLDSGPEGKALIRIVRR